MRSVLQSAVLLGNAFALGLTSTAMAQTPAPRHFAVNVKGDFRRALEVGVNLADIASPAALSVLPPGVLGVLWLGNGFNTSCNWQRSDDQVKKEVLAVKNNPRFSGIYYISDEPHPARCPEAPHMLAARSRMIRSLDPRARTFIVVLNGSADQTEFERLKESADYIGVDPYPCNMKNKMAGCDLASMRRRIEQALTAGIIPQRIVPVYQAFGQECTVGRQPYYRMPSVAETREMLALWDKLVPVTARPFDMVYSWGRQMKVSCPTLSGPEGGASEDLRELYKTYFASNADALR